MLALPQWERRLSYFVWFFHSAAAFFLAYRVSHGPLSQWIGHWLQPSPYFEGQRADIADGEWQVFRRSAHRMVIDHVLHSIAFLFCLRLVPKDYIHLSLALVGLLAQIHMTSLNCVLVLAIFCILMTSAVLLTRSRILAWIVCIGFVVKAPEYIPFTNETLAYYREFNVYLYGAIKILNFCLYLCNNPGVSYGSLWKEHLVYVSYLPYSMSLIVLFEDFRNQLRNRLNSPVCLPSKSTLFFGIRVAFWFVFYDLILHVIHVNSLFHSPFTVIGRLDNYSLSAVAYVTGQFFHVKYVVIFGLPSFFAYLDGLVPPPPPICISRVSRYSRMWRHFDNGLYQFLKHQVYIPLMRPKLPLILSVLRLFVSLVAVFSIVIAWHGARPHYIAWVSLSALELVIEKVGLSIWHSSFGIRLRNRLGAVNSRRIVALSMLFTVVPGIFGVFFFLGEEGIGATIFERILSSGFYDMATGNVVLFDKRNAGFVLLHLLTLGYFFNNVCLDLENSKPKTRIE